MKWEVFECLLFSYFKLIDIGIFQINFAHICQKCLVLGENNFEYTQRFSHPCRNDTIMMSTKEFSTNFKAQLRLFNKKIQFFIKIYTNDAEIFAASCCLLQESLFAARKKKGSALLLV